MGAEGIFTPQMAVCLMALFLVDVGMQVLKAAFAIPEGVAMNKQVVHPKMVLVSVLRDVRAIGTAVIGGALSA